MSEGEEFRYDAFLSYRHVELDRRWATWLHRKLERFRTPKALVAKGHPARLRRIFRDEEELSAESNLSAAIEEALRQSRFLVVVCSSDTPTSKWVNEEVLRFREMERHDRILALLVEGEPSAAFPPALCEIRTAATDGRGGADGPIEDVEPLAADVRRTREESRAFLQRMALLRILAPLLGCRFDDLRRRAEERRRRVLASIVGVSLALAAVFLGLTLYALDARDRADASRDEALRAAPARDLVVLDGLVARAGTLWPDPRLRTRLEQWLEAAGDLRGRLEEHRGRLPTLGAAPSEAGRRFRDDVAEMGRRLEAELTPLETGFRAQVALLDRSFDAGWSGTYARAWGASPYAEAGEEEPLEPQSRLVPLGFDEGSGLFEFAVWGTGQVDVRGDRRGADHALVLVLLPPGRCERGGSDSLGRSNEVPVRTVSFGAPFLMGKYECTRAQWARLRGQGGAVERPREPVAEVSWHEATAALAPFGLRLPTEAEWEYACRAKSTTMFASGDLERDLARIGWHFDNDRPRLERPRPVGTAEIPNDFGLWDMHGNVWEWCADTYVKTYDDAPVDGTAVLDGDARLRVQRGGSYESQAPLARSAARVPDKPTARDRTVGFRAARSVQRTSSR